MTGLEERVRRIFERGGQDAQGVGADEGLEGRDVGFGVDGAEVHFQMMYRVDWAEPVYF